MLIVAIACMKITFQFSGCSSETERSSVEAAMPCEICGQWVEGQWIEWKPFDVYTMHNGVV